MKYLVLFIMMIATVKGAAQEHVTIRIVKQFPMPGNQILSREFAQEFTDLTGRSAQPLVCAMAPLPVDGGHLIGAYCIIESYRKYSFIFVKDGQIRKMAQRSPLRTDNNADLEFTPIQDRFIKINGRYSRLDPNDFINVIAIWDDKPLTLDYLLRDEARILRNAVFAYHGYKFESPDLQEYFAMLPWYKPTRDNVDKLLSKDERWIIDEIIKVEKTR